jgi:hypothetical protein
MTDDLSALALHVERGGDPQPVTLIVAGAIVTGTLVSRAAYLQEMQRFARAEQRPSLAAHVEGQWPASPEASGAGAYVHLTEVEILVGAARVALQIATPGGRPGTASRLARARVEDVHLWTPGVAKLTFAEGPEGEDPDPKARIMQIAPAEPGWRAVYAQVAEGTWTRPVVCWALIHEHYDDEDGKGMTTYVAPIVPELAANQPNGTFVGSFAGNFVGVAAPGEDPDAVRAKNEYIEAIDAADEERLGRRDRSRAGKLLYLYATRTKPGQG